MNIHIYIYISGLQTRAMRPVTNCSDARHQVHSCFILHVEAIVQPVCVCACYAFLLIVSTVWGARVSLQECAPRSTTRLFSVTASQAALQPKENVLRFAE